MKVFDRIAVTIVALVLVAITVFLVGVAWNIITKPTIDTYVSAIYNVNINSWIMTGIACVILIMATALFFVAFSKENKTGRYLNINTLEDGSVRIADATFKDLINRNTNAVEGVKDCSSTVKTIDNGLQLFIKAELEDDVIIPTVCANIQESVKRNIDTICGVNIEKVNVIVDNKKNV
jgi:uncharacterized alkaline shock family protein YloU